MITDEQRKAFEAWFKENRSSGQMPITKLGSYYLAEHESAWKAWQAAQQSKPDYSGWLRAIDEALVCHDIGVANATDTYEQAKDKLNKLLCVVQDIGAYFAKQEPAQAVPVGRVLHWKGEPGLAPKTCIRGFDEYPKGYAQLGPWEEGENVYTAQPAIDDETRQRTLDFVRWIASLKTGGLIQARANDLLRLLEKTT